MEDIRVKLSVLWIFAATQLSLWGDVMNLFYLVGLNKRAQDSPPPMTQGVLLGFSILREIPIAMILVSQMLKPRANRWANMVAGTLVTAAVLLATVRNPTLCYLFFGAIEVACTSLMVWYASRWPKEAVETN